MTRTCEGPGCDAAMVRRPAERPSSFNERRFCSTQCRTEAQRNPVQEKPCAHCGGVCRRRATEAPKHWAERQYCSVSCGRRADLAPVDPRLCGGCGNTYRHDPAVERRSVFLARKACSKRCADQLAGQRRAAVVAPKSCAFCGGEFVRKPSSETVNQFGRRRYCSPTCSNSSRRTIPDGTVVPEVKTCTRCGDEYKRPDRQGPKRWLARRYCGSACGGSTVTPPPRRKAAPAPARTDVPRTVWRPATWGGPVVVQPAPVAEVLNAAV